MASEARASALPRGFGEMLFTERLIGAFRGLRRANWPLYAGGAIVVIVIAAAFLGPMLAPRDPLEVTRVFKEDGEWYAAPFPAFQLRGFPLGSDNFGRDTLSRLLWAVRPTMTMVAIVAAVRLLAGMLLGLFSGWYTGFFGRALEALNSGALAIPVLLVALLLIAALGVESGIWAFILGLGITGWAETGRMVHVHVREIKREAYIEAAHAVGASGRTILLRHVIRQVWPRTWIYLTSEISSTLMATAGLGFLGYYIGGDVWIEFEDFVAARVSGMPELGQMLATAIASEGAWQIYFDPWGLITVGGVIFLAVLGFNLLGEGLRRSYAIHTARDTRWRRTWDAVGAWASDRIAGLDPRRRKGWALIAAGVLLFLLSTLGFYRVWLAEANQGPVSLGRERLRVPGGHLWSGDRGDPHGTQWTDAQVPTSPVARAFFEDPAGLAGGPAVAADGTVYVASLGGQLYALDPIGELRWAAELPGAGMGTPALDAEGNLYVVDEAGGLTSFTERGELRWSFQLEEPRPALTGPIVSSSGYVYYPIGGSIQAVSTSGDPLWRALGYPFELRDSPPRLSFDENLLLWEDLALHAATGEQMDFEIVSGIRHSHVISGDGRYYALSGAGGNLTAIEWQTGDAGLELLSSTIWGLNDITATLPTNAGITSDGQVWLFYGRTYAGSRSPRVRLVWADLDGHILREMYPHMGRPNLVLGMDSASRLYLCGAAWTTGSLCQAYTADREEPLWEIITDAGSTPVGGAIASGRIYLSLEEGVLLAIGDPDELPREAVHAPACASGDCMTPEDHAESAEATPAESEATAVAEEMEPSPEAATTTPPPGGRQHVVQAGEWIWKIARDYGVDPREIIQLNALDPPYTIQPGEVLIIPPAP